MSERPEVPVFDLWYDHGYSIVSNPTVVQCCFVHMDGIIKVNP